MSATEIRDRIAERLRVQRERKEYRRRSSDDLPVVPESNGDLRAAARILVPGTSSAELTRLRTEFPSEYEQLAANSRSRADAVLAGDWNLLGFPVDLRTAVDWHRDPRSEHRFPREFYADLDIERPGQSFDVKYVWELGRHQFLAELARGWLLGGEARHAERARELLLDWIEHNPLYEGVHWTSSLELSMRAISWIWTIAATADWDGWQNEDLARINRSLVDHATYLEHHLSYYSSPYNHLIGEGAGLYLIGAVLPESENATRWQQLGRDVLLQHSERQFYGDGFCVEQATGYHFYTLGFLTLACAAARSKGTPLNELEPLMQRGFKAGLAFRQPGGRWPGIGDIDSARAIPVHHDDFWKFDSLCALGASLFENPALTPPDTRFSEEAYWLLGCAAITRLHEQQASAVPTAEHLPDAGYAIASTGDDWLLFDAGPLGDGLHADATPSTAHGHADTLQVLYRHGGRDLLVDAGMPFYFGDQEWVAHFRGPTAHNTLHIEGAEMARRAGTLAWSHVAPAPKMDSCLTEDVWLVSGKTHWGTGTTIERHLMAIPGKGLWIADHITSDQPRVVSWNWQLPQDSLRNDVRSDEGHTIVEGENLRLETWSDDVSITSVVESAERSSPVAWQAPGYGDHRPAQRLHCKAGAASQILAITFIGSEPLPLEVFIGGKQLSCNPNGQSDRSMMPSGEREDNDADIVWQVEIDGPEVTYCVGGHLQQDKGQSRLLEGVGNLPVVRCSIEASLVRHETSS